MEPIIREENKIYAVGYSYQADWTELCHTVDRAAYWSGLDFSNIDKAAYAGIENRSGMEIAFWLCKETGDFEMRGYEELKDLSEYQAWISGDNDRNVPPGGESGEQMRKRVLEAFSEIREDTVLVAHGGVIAVIMEHLFPEEHKSRYEWQPQNGCGYVVKTDSVGRPLTFVPLRCGNEE
jgi:hypothetical protein